MPVLCVVPSGLRATRAARRLCDAQGGILLGARVTTIEGTASALLAASEERPLLSPLAERLLAIEAAQGAPGFAQLAPESGLARPLAAVIRELRVAEVTADELHRAAADVSGRAAERLRSVAAVLDAYERRLSHLDVLDGSAAIRAAAEAVEREVCPRELRDIDVLVVEGFAALSPPALDLLVALARRARRSHVRIPYFPQRADLCSTLEPLVRRFEGLHQLPAGRVIDLALEDLDDAARVPGLSRVLRGVLGGEESAPGGEGSVLAAAGAGEEGEAEVAAGMAARLLERGFAPDEIAVITPGGRGAAERLSRACSALAVPLATGRGPPLVDAPPVRALREALAAAAQPSRPALEAVLSSPYFALARSPARLRYWLDRSGATADRGDPGQALRRRAATLTAPGARGERSALQNAADALESAVRELRPLAGPGLPREHAARLRAFVSRSGVRRRAGRGELDVVRRDLDALTSFEERTDDLVRALAMLGRGGDVVTAQRWSTLLELAAGGVAAPPPAEPADAVELWSLDEAPGLSTRAAVVVGCSRGAFPASPSPEQLLGDVERAAVNRVVRRTALASASTRFAQARHAAFCAMAAGREALAITWPGAGPEGPGRSAAPLVVEVLAAAGVDLATCTADSALPARRSVAQVLRAAARERRVDAPAELLGSLGARAASALARGAIEEERARAVPARRAARHAGAIPASLCDELARALPAEWSPSQLEEHARCPFRFFAARLLGLSDPETGEVDIDPRDEGQLAHAILERFFRRRMAVPGALPLRGAADERDQLAAISTEVFARFEADGRTGDPAVWVGRRAAVLRRLERVIAAEAQSGEHAVAVLVEYRFGGDAPAPALIFSDGEREVRMRGRLDRVDATGDRIVLVDYKDSKASSPWKKKLQREALGETNFQVPAYLMAASLALPGRHRLEASYLLLRSAERLPPFVVSSSDPLFALDGAARASARASGAIPFADAVVAAVRRIESGELPIASRDCAGCSFGAVCRFESRFEDEP